MHVELISARTNSRRQGNLEDPVAVQDDISII